MKIVKRIIGVIATMTGTNVLCWSVSLGSPWATFAAVIILGVGLWGFSNPDEEKEIAR